MKENYFVVQYSRRYHDSKTVEQIRWFSDLLTLQPPLTSSYGDSDSGYPGFIQFNGFLFRVGLVCNTGFSQRLSQYSISKIISLHNLDCSKPSLHLKCSTRRFLGITKMPLLLIRKLPEVTSIGQVSWCFMALWRHLESFSRVFLCEYVCWDVFSDTWWKVWYLTEQYLKK